MAGSRRAAVKMALDAGVDMSMVPYNTSFIEDVLALVRGGEIPASRVDASVRRILPLKLDLGMFDDPGPDAQRLVNVGAPQSRHELRAVFNALRWFVRAGCPWRLLPNDLPPWWAVQQQTRRWIRAGCFEPMAADLRAVLPIAAGREHVVPTAVVLDSRTLQSTPESGGRAGDDGYKRRNGTKTHIAVDTLGHLPALRVTPADVQDRAQAGALAKAVQTVTGKRVALAYVHHGYTGEQPAAAAGAARRHPGTWSSCPTPSAASCSCRAAGSSNAASAGPHASVASPATMNASLPPSPVSTGSPSSASCSAPSTFKVHDRL